MHSPAWHASKSAQWRSFVHGVSQRPEMQRLSNEQSTLSAHSAHVPPTQRGVEPKQSSSSSQSVGKTQRESWQVQRQSPSHSGSLHTGSAGSYEGFSQAQEPLMQVFATHSAS